MSNVRSVGVEHSSENHRAFLKTVEEGEIHYSFFNLKNIHNMQYNM